MPAVLWQGNARSVNIGQASSARRATTADPRRASDTFSAFSAVDLTCLVSGAELQAEDRAVGVLAVQPDIHGLPQVWQAGTLRMKSSTSLMQKPYNMTYITSRPDIDCTPGMRSMLT